MTKDEALRMAIREMKDAIPHLEIHFDDYFEAIQACKEALEQPTTEQSSLVQEPVAIVSICAETNLINVHWLNVPKDKALLYTTPPSREWVGLSDEEIESMGEEYSVYISKHLARAIEAKLRDKNNG